MYFTVNVSLSFLMISKSMSASAGPTTPGAHFIPMLTSPVADQRALASAPSVGKSAMFGPGRTLPGLAAVHCEVCWLVGFQAHLLHPWTINFDILWMAALANHHLKNHKQSQADRFFVELEPDTHGSEPSAFTLKGLLGTLTLAQVMMMVCLMALVGT